MVLLVLSVLVLHIGSSELLHVLDVPRSSLSNLLATIYCLSWSALGCLSCLKLKVVVLVDHWQDLDILSAIEQLPLQLVSHLLQVPFGLHLVVELVQLNWRLVFC